MSAKRKLRRRHENDAALNQRVIDAFQANHRRKVLTQRMREMLNPSEPIDGNTAAAAANDIKN